MSMVIKNNMAAHLALGELNKNNNKLSKSLAKISSGMKYNSAADGAAEFSISEKMRVRIRGLNQDIVNSQTGTSLIRTAEGGIQEIIENLRNMKAMALNSANDHNTDIDRMTIEKEFEQRMLEINDIASSTSYNGKILLDGTYKSPSSWLSEGKSVVSTYMGYVTIQNNTNDAGEKFASAIISPIPPYYSGFLYPWGDGKVTGPQGNGMHSIGIISAPFSVVDFSSVSFPDDLNQQGFSIVCRDCDDIVNFVFDSTSTTSSYVDSLDGQTNIHQYTIGIHGANTLEKVTAAFFDGIANASGKPTSATDTSNNVVVSTKHNFRIVHGSFAEAETDPSAASLAAGYDYLSSGYYFTKTGATSDYQSWFGIMGKGIITNVSNTEPEEVAETVYDTGNPLIIHTGTKANEAIRVYIDDMHTDALGMDGVRVVPREEAVAALSKLDSAIEYALDQNTRMGAYQSRLAYTIDNLTISKESTQSSESVIRDADMANEMMEYAKNNVLTQSSQAMLAQANQNGSNVLNLLQG